MHSSRMPPRRPHPHPDLVNLATVANRNHHHFCIQNLFKVDTGLEYKIDNITRDEDSSILFILRREGWGVGGHVGTGFDIWKGQNAQLF